MIKIYLNKAAAEIESGQEILTAGMQKIVWVELEFSEDWDGLTKTAVFTNGTTTVDALESSWDGNRVAIAPEVLATAGLYAKIGIYGSNADGVALPTVWCKLGKVWPGADPSGDESTLESLPAWAQLQAAIGSLDDLTTTAKENLVAAINEAAKSGGGGGTSADLSIRVADGKIQWTKDGTTWADLIALSELKGTDGHTPEITATKTDKTTTISVDGTVVAEIKDGENGTDGDDGYSPTATVSKTGTVTTVKIIDKTGTTTAEVKDGEPGTDGTSVTISKISESTADGGSNVVTFNDGKTLTVKNGNKGSDGATPSFSIGTVETLTAGSDATASITGTDEKPVLNLGIPKGADGSSGSGGGETWELIDTISLQADVESYILADFGVYKKVQFLVTKTYKNVGSGNIWLQIRKKGTATAAAQKSIDAEVIKYANSAVEVTHNEAGLITLNAVWSNNLTISQTAHSWIPFIVDADLGDLVLQIPAAYLAELSGSEKITVYGVRA